MNDLVFFYQPKVAAKKDGTFSIYGYEALLRCKKNGVYNVPLDILEKCKDNYEFDIFIIRLLRDSLKKESCFSNKNISVNVHPSFFEFFKISENKIFDGFNCASLDLELLESSRVNDFSKVNKVMNFLTSEFPFIRLALDDFGRDYTSLERIINIENINVIKLDRFLTNDILKCEKKRKVLKWLVEFTHKELNIETVAEGIEDEKVLKFLLDLGVVNFQGFVFGKPMPINEINNFNLSLRNV
ncbi:EAL domain-containing protein [Vibrio crassostreae]|uniref:EAL domain-containing protein n=8 Tax=Vibrio TaxID=662 RepID=A0A4U1YSU5_9VIBR|nr:MULTISPECIES: EAL domain-containing protein [Vibrio]CAK1705852.1 EAL domain-containing protein [Vibrio crassostreae]KAA8679483.1 EAL domain-containing protein [Vibrio gigantis]MCC4890716.1 EAL domain-containing protein [Vibrio sp. F13]PMK73153.1 hypothetical protein BCT92_24165 [Vibrio sp. 10N.261.52.E5]TKF24394.1 EAL domain-containing protein [Vibrio kanaloae]